MTRLCRKCRTEIPNWIVVDGVRHNVSHRKFCLTCSPFKQRNTRPELIDSPTGKLCKCGETRIEMFSPRRFRICRKCTTAYGSKRGRNQRERIRKEMGGKCKYCGFDKYQVALSLHHTDPSKKDPNARGMRSWSWERVLDEIKHCELVCCNCHIAIHVGLIGNFRPVRSIG